MLLGKTEGQEWRSFTPRPSRRGVSQTSVQLGPGKKNVRFDEIGVGKKRWDLFGVGAGMQVVILGLAIWVPILMLRAAPPSLEYETHLLAAPPVLAYEPPKPAPQKFMKPVPVPEPKIAEQPKMEPLKPKPVFQPRIQAPRVQPQQVAKLEAPSVFADAGPAKLDMVPERPGPQRPMPPVKTGVLESTGSSAKPTLTNRPVEQVQTGGFGDPMGVPGNKTGKPGNINALGSFDLPAGPGVGNGTGGSRGARGTVASAGFGSGVATPGSGTGSGGGTRGGVQSTGFGDVAPAAATEGPKPKATVGNPVRTPVEIIAKPNPEYTAEARALRIEGNVQIEVVFRANGTLEIGRMVRGLGHGLDANAIAAAQRIRFRPARENGQPVDQPARVTIEFKLAY